MIGTLLAKALPLIGDVVDRVIPDKEAAAKAKAEVLRMAQAGEFKQLEVELEKERLAASDRDSARRMQAETKDPVPRWLAVGFVIGFFTILFCLFVFEPPAGTQALVNVLLGALAGGVVQILNYYFGSSAGSKNKEALIGGLMNGKRPQTGSVSLGGATGGEGGPSTPALRPLPPLPGDDFRS